MQPISIAARQIERELPYNGIVHLKGSVEIKTPVCLATGPGNAHTCAGYVVLRADQADFHEESGQIEADGNVKLTREPKAAGSSRHFADASQISATSPRQA